MKLRSLLIGLPWMAGAAHAATFILLSGTLNALIPDGNPTGLSSTLVFSGLPDRILDVNIFLTVSGGATGDLYARVSHGDSGFSVLLNRVGKTDIDPFGYADAGFSNVTFSDQADTDVHVYGGNLGLALTGVWQADGRTEDPQLVTDASDRLAPLSAFNDLDANGTWTLFISDLAGGEQATLVSWGVEVTAVPEPLAAARWLFLGLMLGVAVWRQRNRGAVQP